MSMLARYKKSGGITELVKLIEDSGEPKRSNLLKMVRTEDPLFAAEVEGRLYDFEKFKTLPESIVAEVMSTVPPKFVATALYGDSSDFVKLIEKCLGKAFGEYKSEKENLDAKAPTPAQIETAKRKFISEARKAEAAGRIRLPVVQGAGSPSSTGAPAGVPAGGAAPSAAGAAVAGGATGVPVAAAALPPGYPAIAAFNMKEPAAGLSGAALDAFFKSTLGK